MRPWIALLALGCGPAGGGAQLGDFLVHPMPSLARPAEGSGYLDPVFGSKVRRLSARSERGGFEVQVYSQLQAVNADGTLLLTTSDDGYRVRKLDDGKPISAPVSNLNVPRWHPTDRDRLVHYDDNADEVLRVQTTDLSTGRVETLATLSEYLRVRPNQSFEELSRDGRLMAGLATKAGGGQDIFVFDLLAKSVVLRLDLERLFRERCTLPDEWLPSWGTPEPDWLAPSPNGDLLVVQWPANGSLPCRGLETYALPGGERVGNVYAGHQHGDLGLDEDGRQFFMVYEFEEGGFELSVGYRWLPGAASGSAPTTALVPIAWGNAAHISCQGPPGRCLVSSGPGRFGEARDGATPGWQAFENELWSVSLEGAVERLAHHRSSLDGYWAQPRATWSRDGRFVVFASDWGEARGGANDGLGVADVYVIDRR